MKPVEPFIPFVRSVVIRGYRFRSIWNRVYPRPKDETFHEFILKVLLWTLGEEWLKNQENLKPENRHIIKKWFNSYDNWIAANQLKQNRVEGQVFYESVPSGEVKALLQIAYDIFCLQTLEKLSSSYVKRLRNHEQFQGCRYEVGVAALMIRAGFELVFLDDKNKSISHPEFLAKHKTTNVEIAIEAKSRPREGVLNKNGEFKPEAGELKIRNLLLKAIKQKPKDKPYFIFIDLNLPPSKLPLQEKSWFKAIVEEFEYHRKDLGSINNPDPYNALIITNFSYYYGGNQGKSPKGEYVVIVPEFPEYPCFECNQTIKYIIRSLDNYSFIPLEI